MHYPAEKISRLLKKAQEIVAADAPENDRISMLWATLAYVHANEVGNMVRGKIGNRVYSGPFKGMQLSPSATIGAYAPHLLGVYEHELHPAIEQAIATPYQHILNIGCSFGYYSVGLALRMPHAQVHAFDIEKAQQQRCAEMIAFNNVQDRVSISGLFSGADFAVYADKKTLALVDIEGAEKTFLDPTLYPALRGMDMIVELHDVHDPTISHTLQERFAPTHTIEIIANKTMLFDLELIMGAGYYIDPFDSLLAAWESRSGPTPWAVMRVK